MDQSADVVDLHERALDQAAALVEGVTEDQLPLPTPCPDWDVRALVHHLISGNNRFVALAEGAAPQGARPPEGATPDQADTAEELAQAYRRSAEALKEAWRAPGRLEQRYPLPMGELPGRAAVSVRLLETVVHGWDLARATGQVPPFDPQVVEAAWALARQTLTGDRSGRPFAPAQEAPDGAPAIDRLAAFLGRQL